MAAVVPASVGVAIKLAGGRRISCVKGDPGERWFAELCGDGKRPRIFLDDVEQQYAETADEAEGFVTRFVKTEKGHFAYNRVTGEAFRETLYGRVKIVV